MISQMNLGNISKKHLSFKSFDDIPKDFTGSCYISSSIYYFLNGRYHREDGPAIESANGTKEWYLHGKRHREDGPAVEYKYGDKDWWLNGKRHRTGGPAIEYLNGSVKHWYQNGKLHREDGPAYEDDVGNKSWYLNNQLYGVSNDFTNESWKNFQRILIF